MLEIEPDRVAERRMPVDRAHVVVDACDARFDLREARGSHLGNGRFGHGTRVP